MLLMWKTILLLYALAVGVYLKCRQLYSDARPSSSIYSDHVQAPRVRFVANRSLVLSPNQGWIASSEAFTKFHRSKPSAKYLSESCKVTPVKNPATNLRKITGTFKLGSNTTEICLLRCPEFFLCLFEARFNKSWSFENYPYFSLLYIYPSGLKEHIDRLTHQGTYYFVTQGPTSGPVVFIPITYHQKHYYLTHKPGHSPFKGSRSINCSVTLESRAPDGILSFNPTQQV
ncbi:hypothetical protein DSO57_1038057 [Entomophthora muscae]|uniref:Uncharacterized protein n=1 Tax=Entomophthora muscae TaxID=34485 RepID=A0ACC2SMV4_9FUNG|nr:hypothetical protein DSO57_1038057 [Entomophthora muscae]